MGRKMFSLTINLKTKKTLSPCDLETAISLYFLKAFTFPKGFHLYLNEKSFPSFLSSGK